MARSNAAPVTRRNFSRLENPVEVPHLIDIQRRSFEELTDTETGGLRETINDISPIEDYTGNLQIVFGEFKFEEPPHSIEECREKDMTYSRPLTATVAFQNKETGEIREQAVFMGDFPWMTERGTFIINGTERVVVTQLVRSPGAYVMAPKDPEKQVFIANLMPARGSWLELEVDKKGKVFVRIDRKRKLPGHRAAARDGLRRGPETPRPVRQLDLHPHTRSRPTAKRPGPKRAPWSSCSKNSVRASRRASTPPAVCSTSCSSTRSATT